MVRNRGSPTTRVHFDFTSNSLRLSFDLTSISHGEKGKRQRKVHWWGIEVKIIKAPWGEPGQHYVYRLQCSGPGIFYKLTLIWICSLVVSYFTIVCWIFYLFTSSAMLLRFFILSELLRPEHIATSASFRNWASQVWDWSQWRDSAARKLAAWGIAKAMWSGSCACSKVRFTKSAEGYCALVLTARTTLRLAWSGSGLKQKTCRCRMSWSPWMTRHSVVCGTSAAPQSANSKKGCCLSPSHCPDVWPCVSVSWKMSAKNSFKLRFWMPKCLNCWRRTLRSGRKPWWGVANSKGLMCGKCAPYWKRLVESVQPGFNVILGQAMYLCVGGPWGVYGITFKLWGDLNVQFIQNMHGTPQKKIKSASGLPIGLNSFIIVRCLCLMSHKNNSAEMSKGWCVRTTKPDKPN